MKAEWQTTTECIRPISFPLQLQLSLEVEIVAQLSVIFVTKIVINTKYKINETERNKYIKWMETSRRKFYSCSATVLA